MLSEKSVEVKESLASMGLLFVLMQRKEIAEAVHRLFDVDVTSVNTCITRGKRKLAECTCHLAPKSKRLTSL